MGPTRTEEPPGKPPGSGWWERRDPRGAELEDPEMARKIAADPSKGGDAMTPFKDMKSHAPAKGVTGRAVMAVLRSSETTIANHPSASQQLFARRYTFKMYPNKAQAHAMHVQRRLCGDIWNAAIQQREECYRRRGKSLSFYDQSKEVKTLRSECPEFQDLSAATAALAVKAVDLAYAAFFRRLKEGKSFAEAGHPRFHHPDRHPSILFRDRGWKMRKTGKAWRAKFFGIGEVKVRGRFPIDPTEPEQIRSCEVLWCEGAWWLSAVVKLPARRVSGSDDLTVHMNLIDEFARVERNGGMSSPRFPMTEVANHQPTSTAYSTSGVEAGQMAGDDRGSFALNVSIRGVEVGQMAGDDRGIKTPPPANVGVEAGQMAAAARLTVKADRIKSERDTRFKRGSRRWKGWTRRAQLASGKAARIRREFLHQWTSELLKGAGAITLIAPAIKTTTKSAKGDKKTHGNAVRTVAMVNRAILE